MKSKLKCWYFNNSRNLKKDCWKWHETKEHYKREENSIKSSTSMAYGYLFINNVPQCYK